MPSVVSTGTAVPENVYTQDDIKSAYGNVVNGDLRRYFTIFDHAGVQRRHLAFPLEYYQSAHPFQKRNADFQSVACLLAEQAAGQCLALAGLAPDRIDHLISVTTTGIATPSLEARLANRLGLKPLVRRTPMFGLGCAGGVGALALASEYTQAFPERIVLVVATELCGQTFQIGDVSVKNLIGVSLFGDGVAAALVAGDRAVSGDGVRLLSNRSELYPDTLGAMGWDVNQDGFVLMLSQEVPRLIARHIRASSQGLFEQFGLELDEISHFALHPGGPRILDAYVEALDLNDQQLCFSRKVLADYGNLSSASVFFVLDEILKQPKRPSSGQWGWMAALGPGFGCEQILMQW